MKRLIKIQQKLKAPKNQHNSFGNYNYRSAEDILEAVKPLLEEQDLAIVIQDDIKNIGDRFYIKATVNLLDAEGKLIAQTTAFAREDESKKGADGSQITGASSSYARKYALNGLFAIDDTKDADATNTHGKEDKPKQTKTTVKTTQATGDIYAGLKATTDSKSALEYFQAHVNEADDRTKFTTAWKEHIKQFGGNQ